MVESLSRQTFLGLFWTFLETFVLQAFGFVQGIILARILMPSDYGLIAMTGIFFAVSSSLIDSGFTSALIRNKNRKDIDFSTVYVTNVFLSFLLSLFLCLGSTTIAEFYHEPRLRQIVCVNALLMFLGAFVAVQGTRLSIQLQFKTKSIINVIATATTGIASIFFAFMGYGVWSLIYPNFVALLIRAFLYWYYQRWFPGIAFSWQVYKQYFSYGSKIMFSGLLDTLYNNIRPLVVGRFYSASSLGYYTKAHGYAALPSVTVTGILSKVTFPILSKIQNDDTQLQTVYRKMIRVSAYVVFPIMFVLAILARPLVIVLMTEKWIECVTYLQILCFSMMWYPIHALNLNLLMLKGRSSLFLRLEIIKKILGIVVLVVTIPMGLSSMCYGAVLTSIVSLFINTYYTGTLMNVGFIKQMKDLGPTVCYSVAMGLIVYVLISLCPTNYQKICVGVIVGFMSYLIISRITHSADYIFLLDIIEHNVAKKWSKIIRYLR